MRITCCVVLIMMILGCTSKTTTRSIEVKPEVMLQSYDDDLELAPEEYINWINNKDNGLYKSKEIQNVIYTLKAKPIDFISAIESNGNLISAADHEKFVKDLDGMLYFDFKISIEDFDDEFIKYKVKSNYDYQERIKYCAFEMQRDFSLIADNDTISCSLFHFERTFGIVPYGSFQLGFEKPESLKELTIVYEDRLFENGIIKIKFPEGVLLSLPKIKTI